MAQTLAMRATSLAASTALLALAGIAAFSMKWVVSHFSPEGDPRTIITVSEQTTPPRTSHVVQPLRPPDQTQPAQQTIEPLNVVPISANPPGAGPAIPDPVPPTITNAHWLQTPRDLARYYPMMALRRDIEGDVQLDCLVTTTGSLQCSVASETPANWGFGAAAIRIAQDYRMVPAMRDGAPVEGRYRMRVPFRLNR